MEVSRSEGLLLQPACTGISLHHPGCQPADDQAAQLLLEEAEPFRKHPGSASRLQHESQQAGTAWPQTAGQLSSAAWSSSAAARCRLFR